MAAHTAHVEMSLHAPGRKTDLRVSLDALKACSNLLGGIAESSSSDTIRIEVHDEWDMSIIAYILTHKHEQDKSIKERIFQDEPSVVTERLVRLYHTLDKYDMSSAMKAFQARLLDDIMAGILSARSILTAYHEHPSISRMLANLVDHFRGKFKSVAPLNASQLEMMIRRRGASCVLVFMQDYQNYEHVISRYLICKVPEKEEDYAGLPGGTTRTWLRKYFAYEATRTSRAPSPSKWAVIKLMCVAKFEFELDHIATQPSNSWIDEDFDSTDSESESEEDEHDDWGYEYEPYGRVKHHASLDDSLADACTRFRQNEFDAVIDHRCKRLHVSSSAKCCR